ncbi:beta-lactamase [Acetobacteraceae bacterium AT-5844]|nr:beta-lactamase [Acetobacteraceae bacterium AT-5844]
MTLLPALQASAKAEIARIAAFAEGETGVAALHMETGEAIGFGEHGRYPPGSSIKMALVLCIFAMVDRGELSLDDMIEVDDVEMTSSGPLGGEFVHAGVALSLINLIEVTITRSDNTATDVLFRLAGGPAAVQAWLRDIGIDDFDVTLSMREALCVMHELSLPPSDVSIRTLLRDQPPEVMDARERTHGPGFDYQLSVRDHCTPLAMLELLRRLYQLDGVSARTRELLLPIMQRTPSFNRIRARLPKGVVGGTKPGSGSGTCSDVGFITLPVGRGTFAISVQVKASPRSMAEREVVVADITRLIYDYFLLITSPEAA